MKNITILFFVIRITRNQYGLKKEMGDFFFIEEIY